VVTFPSRPTVPAGLLAFALLGWFVFFALAFADFLGGAAIPWAAYVAGFFAVVGAILLILALSQGETRELERLLATELDSLAPPAA
jgi:hypothetical protein